MYYGDKVKLRAIEIEDLDNIMINWNNWDLRKFLLNPIPMSRQIEKDWLLEASKSSPDKDGRIVLVVEDRKTENFIGTISLFKIDRLNSRAELGIALHYKETQGKGYGTDALTVLLWVAFNVININVVYLVVLEDNLRAIAAYEKAGFKKNGIMREAAFCEGKYKDLIFMDILRKEFFSKYPAGKLIGSN